MGTFDGIQIGSTGLGAQRRGVEVAGQNIANVNTDGYTRQRVEITPDAGPVTPAFHSTWDGSGLGVRSVEVARLRDVFLDRRAREESALQSQLQVTAGAYRSVEQVFNEPSDTGFSAVLGDFLAAWDDLANNPGDVGARSQLVETGRTLADDVNQLRSSLQALADNHQVQVESLVSQVNADAAQVAELQDSIRAAQAAGLNVNELLDQRDALLQSIAEKVGGVARHEDDGTVSFFVGGVALIRGTGSLEMAVEQTSSGTRIVWPLDGRDVVTGGEAAGLLGVVNDLVPDLQAELGAMADTLMADVNALHTTGYDRNGDPGLDFFVSGPNGYEVNPAIAADPALVAAGATPGTLDGSVALQIAGLEGADESYRQLIVRLGVSSQTAQRRVQLQDAVVEQVRAEQEAANGVNLDEELSDLVRFQRAYEASSRFISAVDELLNTLINGTGRVGR